MARAPRHVGRRGRKGLAIGLILGLMSVLVAARPVEADPALKVPTLHWVECGAPFQCATAAVPLDYDEPNGPTITLALTRRPADDPGRRIGSMFINPGGPGGPGTGVVRAAEFLWTPEVLARFDIIGFDPRGVGASTPLQCFPSNAALDQFLAGTPFFPYRDDQVAPYVETFRRYGQQCLRNGGPILRHMSTADVARDMDLLRQAVGDEGLTYDGVSYGSFLGNVYANLFPDKVRAVVIDGVLDPVAWTTGRPPSGALLPFSMRLGSAHGADGTLDHFLKTCEAAGPARCALAPGARAKFDRLDARAKQAPVPNGPGGEPLTYDLFNAILLGELYDSTGWEFLAEGLREIYDATFSPSAGSPATAALATGGFAYDNGFDAFLAVACADSVNPRDPAAWPRAVAQQARFAPVFAANWTYASEPCSTWPVVSEDHYLGPFDRVTAAPVLVIGNVHDPATPYHGAKTVDELLPHSRLLTLNAAGHTSWMTSPCIDKYVEGYLVRGHLPPVGTACAPAFRPFTQPASSAQVAARRAILPPSPGPRWGVSG